MKKRRRLKRNYSIPAILGIFVLLAAILAYLGASLLTPGGAPSLQPPSSSAPAPPSSHASSSLGEESPPSSPSSSGQSSLPQPSGSQSIDTGSSSAPAQQQDDWRLILVNKTNRLEKELDIDLVDIGGFQVDARIKNDLEAMLKDAAAQGVRLSLVSTYRPFSRSAYLYDNKVGEYIAAGYTRVEAEREASMWVAPPGTSEHVTGLAADIVSGDYYTKLPDLLPEFADFEEAKWLKANCAQYGFILRYPKGKEELTGVYFEPWHFRYVGQEHARAIMEQGITLEEYLQQPG